MQEMEAVQAKLDDLMALADRADDMVDQWSIREFTASADEGRIVATTDALGSLLKLDINPLSRRRLDAVELADAILTAVVAAEEAAATSKDELMNGLRAAQRAIERRY
ncbi:DNA-binding protein YbaB [Nonomuraea dietziae]|uniref:DNA-binding protein YbaB n=2 Tax=Nonomuraea dietziae TaxID=65515 RepID=A0A7W5V131_9ACTN|nr:DNA-binding protein YbaB [Nonomuraea dietziae]